MNDDYLDDTLDDDFYGAEYPEDEFDQEQFDTAMALDALEEEEETP